MGSFRAFPPKTAEPQVFDVVSCRLKERLHRSLYCRSTLHDESSFFLEMEKGWFTFGRGVFFFTGYGWLPRLVLRGSSTPAAR